MPKPEIRPSETPWGKAIDFLLDRKVTTLGDLCRAIQKEHSQIYNWRFKGKRGPTVENVSAILTATSSTWHDWADAMMAAEDESEGYNKPEPTPLNKPPSRKPTKHGQASHRPPSNW